MHKANGSDLQERRRGGRGGGQAHLLPFSKRGKGARVTFSRNNIYFFNNVQFDIVKTMNLTRKLNNHRVGKMHVDKILLCL